MSSLAYPEPNSAVITWLLDADPAIRWQVMGDLLDAPQDQIRQERARVATEGWGAQLLALQAEDGAWGGAAWNRGWDSTMHAIMLLRDLGLDPASEQATRALARVRANVTWGGDQPWSDNPLFAGEVEPCINGQIGAAGAYFQQDVSPIVDRLLGEQLPDGGWNCEAENGSTRSSFNTTICVLEALLDYELQTGPDAAVSEARRGGQEYLLDRHLMRRKSTGEVIPYDRKLGPTEDGKGPVWTRLAFPTWWHYDVLRGLAYMRRAGVPPQERMAEAIDVLALKRDEDGRWPLDVRYAGRMPIEIDDGVGRPSRWMTLRALRVLRWFAAGHRAA